MQASNLGELDGLARFETVKEEYSLFRGSK